MKCFVFVLLLSVAFAQDVQFGPEPPPHTSTSSSTSTTTLKPTTSSSTTSTTPSSTTSSSTTTSSTTSSSTTSSSTSSSTTSTTPVPSSSSTSTTARPTPSPKPKIPDTGHWFANYTGSNFSCVVLNMAIQLELKYHRKVHNDTNVGLINVPAKASADGTCTPQGQSISLQWNNTKNDKNKVLLIFEKKDSTYHLQHVNVTIYPDDSSLPDFNGTGPILLSHNHSDFATSLSKSYKCDKEQTLNFESHNNKTMEEKLHVWNVQFQAYQNNTGHFLTAEDCQPFDTPDIVPLAVGCALAGLVIIVLIAYLIGRKRAQARGYLSITHQ